MIQNKLQPVLMGRIRLFWQIIILFLVAADSNCAMDNEQYNARVSFDYAFRNSWFKKTLDACMSAWGMMREEMRDSLLPHERNLLAEVVLGKLAYANFCAAQIKINMHNNSTQRQNGLLGNRGSHEKIRGDGDLCKRVADNAITADGGLLVKLPNGMEQDYSGKYGVAGAYGDTGDSNVAPEDMAYLMRVVQGMMGEYGGQHGHYFDTDYAQCMHGTFNALTALLNSMM